MPSTTAGLGDGACSTPSTAAASGLGRECRQADERSRQAGPARTHATARCPPASPSSDASLPAVPSTAPPRRGRPAYRSGLPRCGVVHERRSRGRDRSCGAISRTPLSWTLSSAISSRSANDKYRPVGSSRLSGVIPPAWRNHRDPTGHDTPTPADASTVVIPVVIRRQNSRCTARDGSGRPGDRIAGRNALSAAHCRRAPSGRSGHGFLELATTHLHHQSVATTS